MKLCALCNKHLVKIGDKRSNGKYGLTDWDSRKYHKKCYILCQQRISFLRKMSNHEIHLLF